MERKGKTGETGREKALSADVYKRQHEVCRSLRHLFKKQQLLLSASERKDRQEKSEAGRKEEKEEGTQ